VQGWSQAASPAAMSSSGARRVSARVCRSGCTGPSAGARRRPPSEAGTLR
jgi:hypothetical protein